MSLSNANRLRSIVEAESADLSNPGPIGSTNPAAVTATVLGSTFVGDGLTKPVLVLDNGMNSKARIAKLRSNDTSNDGLLWSCLSFGINGDWSTETGYVLDAEGEYKSVLQMEYDYSSEGGEFIVSNSGGDALFTLVDGTGIASGGATTGLSDNSPVWVYSGDYNPVTRSFANDQHPGNFSPPTNSYFVRSLSGNTFKLSSSYNGTAIPYSSAGTNVHVFNQLHEINWTVGGERLLHTVSQCADPGRGVFYINLPSIIDTSSNTHTTRVEPTFRVLGKRGANDWTTLQIRGYQTTGGGASGAALQLRSDAANWGAYVGFTSGFGISNTNQFVIADNSVGAARIWCDEKGNIGLGGKATDPKNCPTSFGTNAEGVLALINGVEPTTAPADTIQLFSIDHSGSTTLGLRVEKAVETAPAPNTTHKIPIRVNGADYNLPLEALAGSPTYHKTSLGAFIGGNVTVLNNSTTLTPVTGLSIPLEANMVYEITAFVSYANASNTAGNKFRFQYSGTANIPGIDHLDYIDNTGARKSIVMSTGFTTYSASGSQEANAVLRLTATIFTTTAGNLTFESAQVAAEASNHIVRHGSSLRATLVGTN